jgi:hypothetical protein
MDHEITIENGEREDKVTIMLRLTADGKLIPLSAVDGLGLRYHVGLTLTPEVDPKNAENILGRCCCPDGNGGWDCRTLQEGQLCSCAPQ